MYQLASDYFPTGFKEWSYLSVLGYKILPIAEYYWMFCLTSDILLNGFANCKIYFGANIFFPQKVLYYDQIILEL